MTKRTKPKQAASARTLDRWQVIVQGALTHLDVYAHPPRAVWRAKSLLRGLLRSMQRAERR